MARSAIMLAPMTRAAVLLVVLALLAVAPALAPAQTPFAPLPPAQQPQQTATQAPPRPSSQQDDGLKTWQQTLIFLAGLALLGGIGWAIVSDARSRAPVVDRDLEADRRTRGARVPPARRKQQRRAKGKTARAQRRRNR